MNIAVIVPTLNEAGNIGDLIPQIHAALKNDYSIVIIDDNSKDGTQDIVKGLSAAYPIKLIARPGKLGLASAVIDGMNSQKADAYIVMDADFSHPPELLSVIRDSLNDHDLVVASRHVKGGGASNWPLKRKIISLGAITLARPLTRVKDVTSGYFAIRRVCLDDVELTPLGYKIGLECFVKANWKSYVEIPFIFTDRKSGSSKLGSGEFIAYVKHLRKLYAFSTKQYIKRSLHT
jgi:dolichol-phosphate mannosyltransferase